MRTTTTSPPPPSADAPDPRYAAVERVEGDAATARADVYALGAMLYHVLAARAPHAEAGGTRDAVALAALRGPPRPLRELAGDAPAALVAVVETAMARHADDRYRDARAFAAALRDLQLAALAAAPAVARRARMQRWLRRHPVAIALVATTATAAAVAAALAIADLTEARDDARLATRHAEHATTDALEELGRTALLGGDLDRAAPLLASAYAAAGADASPELRFLVRSMMRQLDGRELTLPPGAPVRGLAFAGTDRRLLVMRDAGAEQWSAINGAQLARLDDGDAAISTAQYCGTGAIVSATDGDVVRLWDAHAGHLLHRIAVPDLRIAIVSTDDRRLLTIDGAGTATVREVSTLAVLSTAQLDGDIVRQSPFDTGVDLVAYDGSGDATVWFWDGTPPPPAIHPVAWARLGGQTSVSNISVVVCGPRLLQVHHLDESTGLMIRTPPTLISCAVDPEGQVVVMSDHAGLATWFRASDAHETSLRVGGGPAFVRWVAPATIAASEPYSNVVSIFAADSGMVTARYVSIPGVPAAVGGTGRLALARAPTAR